MNQQPWLKMIMARSHCVACSKILTDARVLGAGMAEPVKPRHASLGVTVLIVVRCPDCGYNQALFGYAPDRTVFLKILNEVATSAWKKFKDNKGPKPVDGPCPFDQLSMGVPVKGPEEEPETTHTVRPSLRPCTPNEPISDAEIKRFVRRLHRLPLRRTSKGFREWLRKMTE